MMLYRFSVTNMIQLSRGRPIHTTGVVGFMKIMGKFILKTFSINYPVTFLQEMIQAFCMISIFPRGIQYFLGRGNQVIAGYIAIAL